MPLKREMVATKGYVRKHHIHGSGHWENFKKIGLPILGTVAALGAAYAGSDYLKEIPYKDKMLDMSSTAADKQNWMDRQKIYEARDAWRNKYQNLGRTIMNFDKNDTDTNIKNYMKMEDDYYSAIAEPEILGDIFYDARES
jgi:hypothetical protein